MQLKSQQSVTEFMHRQSELYHSCHLADSNCTVSLIVFQQCPKVQSCASQNQWNGIDFFVMQPGNLCHLTGTFSWFMFKVIIDIFGFKYLPNIYFLFFPPALCPLKFLFCPLLVWWSIYLLFSFPSLRLDCTHFGGYWDVCKYSDSHSWAHDRVAFFVHLKLGVPI